MSDFFLGISPIPCPACGAENGRTDRTCTACGEALPFEEDDEDGVEILSNDGGRRQRQGKIPVERSANLLKLREVAAGVADGTISIDDYRTEVDRVTNVAFMGCELFKSEPVKQKVAALPPEEAVLAYEIAAHFGDYHAGCQRMQQYVKSGNLEDAQQGLAQVERALHAMDKARDVALDIAANRP